jgi:hypothetical protein
MVPMVMMDADRLRNLAAGVRGGSQPVDDELVARIEGDVGEYRQLLVDRREQTPVPPLDKLLPLMGWLIYEASLKPLWSIPPDFTGLDAAAVATARAKIDRIRRLANAARGLPWPEYAPRALGAIRVQALIESKKDTVIGYDAAWTLHTEARTKYSEYRDSLGTDAARERFVRDCDEVLLPLALAETGTACRAAERVISHWAEDHEGSDPAREERDSASWTQRMFRELTQGAAVGELALRTAENIEQQYGLVHQIDEERLSMKTAFRNPAIMTSRALVLLYSLTHEMNWLGRLPETGTWDAYRKQLVERFFKAFALLLRPATDREGRQIPLEGDHLRSMVQLCLHLALVVPGRELPQDVVVDESLTLHRLDDHAVEAMSAWLAADDNSRTHKQQRGDANVIGSASKPSFIASVEACRRDTGAAADYRAWRRRWPELDRYVGHDGRAQRINGILETIPPDHPLVSRPA